MSSAGLVPLPSRPATFQLLSTAADAVKKHVCHQHAAVMLHSSGFYASDHPIYGARGIMFPGCPSVGACVRARKEAFSGRLLVCSRRGTGSHFVTQRPSDPRIQRPKDPVDPVVTLFYNELQMSTYVADKRLQWARGLPVFIAVWRLHASEK